MLIEKNQLYPLSIFALLLGLMFIFSIHTLTSIYQDIGRHIRLGEIIWKTGHIPSTNLFSFTARDFLFINHHWLGEVLLYLGNRIFGLTGLIVVKAGLMALAFGLSLAAAWRSRLAIPAALVGLISVFILVERTDVRPEILSFVFFAWFIFVLLRKSHARLVWTLPFTQLLWVNTHIYFFLGPFLFLAWWLGETARSGRAAWGGRKYWMLGILVAIATLINPAGIAGALYPLRIFSNYGYSVMENKSPFFLAGFGYPQITSYALYLGIVLMLLSSTINYRKLRENIFLLTVSSVTGVLALMMVRNFPLFGLALVPTVLRNLDEAGWEWAPKQGMAAACSVLALVGLGVVSNQFYNDFGLLGRQFGLYVPSGPQAPIDFFRRAGLKGPIFNNFDIGSYLIWKLPEEPVFIDGRPEAYPADFIQNVYIKMQEDASAWDKYSRQYGLNAIIWGYSDITPWSQIFVQRILKDSSWVPVYRGDGIFILVKNTPQNTDVISKYSLR